MENLKKILLELDSLNINGILFYDLSVLSLAKKLEKYANTFKFSNVKKVCESSFVEDHSSSVLNKKVDRTKKLFFTPKFR